MSDAVVVRASVSNETNDNGPPKRAPRHRKPGSIKWKDRDMIPILMSYKKHPVLWNNKLPEFKNKALRDAALLDIALNGIPTQQNVTREDVLNKINNIRTTYNIERTRVMHGEKFGFDYESKLYWYQLADEFLQPVTGQRKSRIGVIYKSDSSSDDNEVVPELSVKKNEISENNKPAQYEQPSITLHPVNEVKKQPKEKEDQFPVQFIHRGTKRYGSEKINPQVVQEEDEFDFFGKAIAVQLRKMPLSDALSLHQELMSLMNKALVNGVQTAVETSSNTQPPIGTPSFSLQPTFNGNTKSVVKSEDDSDGFGEEYEVCVKMEDDDDDDDDY